MNKQGTFQKSQPYQLSQGLLHLESILRLDGESTQKSKGFSGLYNFESLGFGASASVYSFSTSNVRYKDCVLKLFREEKDAATEERILQKLEGIDGIPKMVERIELCTLIHPLGIPAKINRKVILDIVDILKEAHDREVIHRDVRPENIIEVNDKTYLIDWAYAVELNEPDTAYSGTYNFASPEVLQSLMQNETPKASKKNDLYSVFWLALELLKAYHRDPTRDRKKIKLIQSASLLHPFSVRLLPLINELNHAGLKVELTKLFDEQNVNE